MGKPVSEARGEVRYAASFIEWYAEEAKRVYGETLPSQAAGKRLIVNRQPVGPVYAITPWEFSGRHGYPQSRACLGCGCTSLLERFYRAIATYCAVPSRAREAAGGPADVFQVITTLNPAAVSEVFLVDPRIRKLSFTGSTEVGMRLYAQSAPTMKRISSSSAARPHFSCSKMPISTPRFAKFAPASSALPARLAYA